MSDRKTRKLKNRIRLRVRKKKKILVAPMVLTVIFAGILVFSLVQITTILLAYRKGNREYISLTATAVTQPQEEAERWPYLMIDFSSLRGINPDLVGWIDIPGTGISYPVVQGYDNDEYLRQSFEGEYYVGGSIFIDYLSAGDWSDANTIVYGHHMYDGSMFSGLAKFMKQDFREDSREIHIYTEKGLRIYDVFSAYRCDVGNSCYTRLFSDASSFNAWCHEMGRQSAYDTGILPSHDDYVLTLSTCTGVTAEERYVVQAVYQKTIPYLSD